MIGLRINLCFAALFYLGGLGTAIYEFWTHGSVLFLVVAALVALGGLALTRLKGDNRAWFSFLVILPMFFGAAWISWEKVVSQPKSYVIFAFIGLMEGYTNFYTFLCDRDRLRQCELDSAKGDSLDTVAGT